MICIILESGLTDMLNTGLVPNQDGTIREDSRAYYELSLTDSKKMEAINENLKKTIEQFLQSPKLNP